MKTSLIPTKKKVIHKDPLINKFKRLKVNIQKEERKIQEMSKEFDECLVFELTHIQQQRNILFKVIKEKIKALYTHYKSSSISKKTKRLLKEILIEDLDDLFAVITPDNVDSELKEIFQDLKKVSYDKVSADALDQLKEAMASMFHKEGIDVDFSDLDLNDSEEVIREKIFASMNQNGPSEEEHPFWKKNRGNIEREKKETDLEATLKKKISSIYKQLAKIFHPDLEYDLEHKMEKEALMKKLTSAYRENDLNTILSLESEWVKGSSGQLTAYSQEDLKIYTNILNHQLRSLQRSKDTLISHPKYLPLHHYVNLGFFNGLKTMRFILEKLKEEEATLRELIQELQGFHSQESLQSLLNCFLF